MVFFVSILPEVKEYTIFAINNSLAKDKSKAMPFGRYFLGI